MEIRGTQGRILVGDPARAVNGCRDVVEAQPYPKVHGANMGLIWDRQDPGGPHVGPVNFAISVSASDLHNARATILNPFNNIDYKIIEKIRWNKTWIEADNPCINLISNRYNALDPAIVYVTIPFRSMTS